MPFLTATDYPLQIKNEIKTIITQNDASVQTDAELKAQSQMESYLRKRYDVANVFNKTGTERNATLVMLLVDMVIYHMHSCLPIRNVPEERANRYDYAIKYLEAVADGAIEPDLPAKTDANGNAQGLMRLGSDTPTEHGF